MKAATPLVSRGATDTSKGANRSPTAADITRLARRCQGLKFCLVLVTSQAPSTEPINASPSINGSIEAKPRYTRMPVRLLEAGSAMGSLPVSERVVR